MTPISSIQKVICIAILICTVACVNRSREIKLSQNVPVPPQDVRTIQSKLDLVVNHIRKLDLVDLSIVEKELKVSLTKDKTLEYGVFSGAREPVIYTGMINAPDSLFEWVTYSRDEMSYDLTLGLKPSTCFENTYMKYKYGGQFSSAWPGSRTSIMTNHFVEAHRNQSAYVYIGFFEPDDRNYIEYESEENSISEEEKPICVRRVNIGRKIKSTH